MENNSYHKLNQDEWLKIEVEIPENEKIIAKVMKELGESKKGILDAGQLRCIGEDLYNSVIKEILIYYKFLKDDQEGNTKTSKTKEKKGKIKPGTHTKQAKANKNEKKEDTIIAQMTPIVEKRLKEQMDHLIKIYSDNVPNNNFITFSIENEDIIEIKLVILIFISKRLNKVFEERHALMNEGYEYVIGVSNMISLLENMEFTSVLSREGTVIKSPVSSSLIKLLKTKLDSIKTKLDFKISDVFEKYPEFILSTKYSKYLGLNIVKPYDNQKDIIQTLKDDFNHLVPSLILYKSAIGTGKTTTALALAYLVNTFKTINPEVSLIYACSIEVVRHYIGRIAYNSDVKFAIAAMHEGKLRVVNSWKNKNENFPELIISDYYTTKQLLKTNKNYILLLDEPTVGANDINSPITKLISEIFEIAPKHVILSSATLPNEDELVSYIDFFKMKYHKAQIKTITSSDSFVGCQIFDYNFKNFMPYNHCKTIKDLKLCLNFCRQNSLLMRTFNGLSLLQLSKTIKEMDIKDTRFKDDLIEHTFKDVSKINHNNVVKIFWKYLELIIAYGKDEVVEKLCNVNFDFEEKNTKLQYNKLGTELSYHFLNGCLIATDHPEEFLYDNFKELYENVDEVDRKVKKYFENEKNMEVERREIETKYYGKDDRLRDAINKFEKDNANEYYFPEQLEINTKYHQAKYNPDYLENINLANLRRNIIYTEKIYDLPKDKILKMLLVCGVGIYDGTSSEYSDLILKHIQERRLAYMVANEQIIFGANFPLNNVIVTEDLKSLTINNLFQLLGRTGRVGYSSSSKAFLNNKILHELQDYIINVGQVTNKEAVNMELSLKNVTGYDEKNTVLNEYIKSRNKICFIYSYNDIEAIYSLLILMIYEIQNIKKQSGVEFNRISIELLFEFVKLHSDVCLDNDCFLPTEFYYDKIYVLQNYPRNPTKYFKDLSEKAKNVIVFEHYNKLKEELVTDELADNVKLYPHDCSMIKVAKDLIEKDSGTLKLQLKRTSDIKETKENKENIILNYGDVENTYINDFIEFINSNKFNAETKDGICLNLGLHSSKSNLNFEVQNPDYDIITEMFRKSLKDRISEGNKVWTDHQNNLKEMFKKCLTIMEFKRKEFSKNIEKSELNEFETMKKVLYKNLSERDPKNIFIGLYFSEKVSAALSPVLIGMGYDLCKEFLIEERILFIRPADSKISNSSLMVVEFHSKSNSGISVIPYVRGLKGISNDILGKSLVKKEDISRWQLYSVKK